jgi:hypothetical protein
VSVWSLSASSADSSRCSTLRGASVALPDLEGLLRALVDEGVEFVLIGGLAVATHGFVRATEHIDVVPAPQRENLDRLLNRLLREGARLSLAPTACPAPTNAERCTRDAT